MSSETPTDAELRKKLKEDAPSKYQKGCLAQDKSSTEEICQRILSDQPGNQYIYTQAARKQLSQPRKPPPQKPPTDTQDDDDNEPIYSITVRQSLINSGTFVPRMVQFLQKNDDTSLQFEAAWVLTNIASGTSDQTKVVVNAGAIPHFIALLSSPVNKVCEQTIWALGNIAGDGPLMRDSTVGMKIIEQLLPLAKQELAEDDGNKVRRPISFIRNVTWAISNFCRNKNPSSSFEKVRGLLPTLNQLTQHRDPEVLVHACRALSYLKDEIKNLQTHENNEVYRKALDILDRFFTDGDDEDNEVPKDEVTFSQLHSATNGNSDKMDF